MLVNNRAKSEEPLTTHLLTSTNKDSLIVGCGLKAIPR